MTLVGYGPRFVRADRGLLVESVKRDWAALEFASEELRGDQQLVLSAVQQSWRAIEFASHVELPVMMEAVRQDWRAIERIVRESRSEEEILALVQSNPRVIQTPKLQGRKFAVLAAVKLDGPVLQYAAPE